jgi:hypothetical protein
VALSAPPAGWVFAVSGLLGENRDFGCGRLVGLGVQPAVVVRRSAHRELQLLFRYATRSLEYWAFQVIAIALSTLMCLPFSMRP